MSYTAWSVIFNEQPTAAKWNRLGANDASFKDGTGIASLAITKTKLDFSSGIWWEELGRDTRATAGTTLSVTSFTGKKYLQVCLFVQGTAATTATMRFNNDSAANYAYRRDVDGQAAGPVSADATTVSQTSIDVSLNVSGSARVHTMYIANYGTEKMVQNGMSVSTNTAGAGTAPRRVETVSKWVNSNTITRIDITGGANFGIGSTLAILGHD